MYVAVHALSACKHVSMKVCIDEQIPGPQRAFRAWFYKCDVSSNDLVASAVVGLEHMVGDFGPSVEDVDQTTVNPLHINAEKASLCQYVTTLSQ